MDSQDKMETVKNHFDEEARIFDETILKLIPHYNEMIEALVNALPFDENEKLNIIDLGCGTGTIALKIKHKFKNAAILCVDISDNMINAAKSKLKDYDGMSFTVSDFYHFNFTEKYDAAVSSLALHHLVTGKDKIKFYRKIFRALNRGASFYNADLVLASEEKMQEFYISKWIKFMNKFYSMDEINNKWLEKNRVEDNPSKLYDQLVWLEKTGFKKIDVIWKYYNFAVYGGKKF